MLPIVMPTSHQDSNSWKFPWARLQWSSLLRRIKSRTWWLGPKDIWKLDRSWVHFDPRVFQRTSAFEFTSLCWDSTGHRSFIPFAVFFFTQQRMPHAWTCRGVLRFKVALVWGMSVMHACFWALVFESACCPIGQPNIERLRNGYEIVAQTELQNSQCQVKHNPQRCGKDHPLMDEESSLDSWLNGGCFQILAADGSCRTWSKSSRKLDR